MMGSDSIRGGPGSPAAGSGVAAAPPPPEPMFSMINTSQSGISQEDQAPGFDQGHSLPSVSELKTSQQASMRTSEVANEDGSIRRRGGWMVWLALFLAIFVIVIIVVVAVVATNNANNKTPSSTTSATQSRPQVASTPAPFSTPVLDQKEPTDHKETGSDITQAPVAAPVSSAPVQTLPPEQRVGAIKQWLTTQAITSTADLETEGSPQQKALTWIAHNDGLKLEPPQGDWKSADGYEFTSRYALATFYFSTMGRRTWAFDLNFLKPTSVCYWYAILQYVDSSTELRGVFCDQTSGLPVALFLNQNNMHGSLPPEMGFLTSVTDMDLDFNNIGGSIPDTFQQMTNMVNLFAAGNRLEGSIPPWMGQLSELKNINFSTNYMTGRLPVSLGNLQNMEGLALDNNLFTNNLDNVFDSSVMPGFRNLEQFYLENNQFTGTLGAHFLKEMNKLQYLDVSDNQFGGSIPEHLFSLPALKVLDLHDNAFSNMPTLFQENTNLGLLAMQKNQLKDMPIPPSINQLKSLFHLDVSQNQFVGEIPTSMGDLKNLTYLFLAQNSFSPNNVPYWIEGLTKLEELSLKGTQRTGPIPDFLGDLKQMILLDLDDNSLMGTIPTKLGQLENLHILLLNRNNLTSVIPDSFSSLKSLKLMYVEANDNIQGNLGDLFCANPAYVAKPVIVADCEMCDAVPGCCAICCPKGEECNTGIHVPDLDPIWQLGYNRVFFTFGREDFLEKTRDPNSNQGGQRGRMLVDKKKLVGPFQKRLGQRGSL